MPPLRYYATAEEARKTLLNVLERSPRARVVEVNDVYLRVEFTTLVFRFVDDVEFLIDPDAKLVHFRSASRVGHSDLGTNRRRMSALCRRLTALGFTEAR
jgi:uncharacterized protein (DUF1499 family)